MHKYVDDEETLPKTSCTKKIIMSNEQFLMNPTGYESDEDGFECEDLGETEDLDAQEKPFDPKKVDVSISTPNMGSIINRLKHEEINLMPDFQRSGDLWSREAQSRLIESMLIRLPIPAFYFDAISDDRWQVVDGLQRLSAISNFVITKKLRLTKLEFLKDYEGFYYDDLPRSLARRIDEFQTSVYLIKPGTPLMMKYSLFHRINTGGLKLTRQEIRHAMSQSIHEGVASKFLGQIVQEKEFIRVVGNQNNRMSYQELVLRHMAFRLLGHGTYKSSLPKFLDQAMLELSDLKSADRDLLRDDFLKSMSTAYKLFDKDAFKKTLAEPKHKKVVNKPLFDAVSVCIAVLDDDARTNLIKHVDKFREEFKVLLKSDKFHDAISRSTSNKDKVEVRFDKTMGIIEKFSVKDL